MKELQRSSLFQTRSYMQSYSVASICVLFEVAVIFLIMFIKSFGCQIGMLSPVMWSESNQEFPLLCGIPNVIHNVIWVFELLWFNIFKLVLVKVLKLHLVKFR